MVPNGWENVLLGEVFDFRNGINADKSQYGQGVKFVNVMDVFGNNILTEPKIIGRISISDKKLDDNRLEYGDVLFNRTSETFDEIAMSAVYLDDADATFGGFVIRGRPLTNNLDPKYTVYAFQDSNFRKQVIKLGQGAVRANIGQKDLVKVELLVPPFSEQQKIAKILSTWDKAISTTERLIENSTQQKKALMQQLLTGKKRLLDESGKRFDGEWSSVLLGDISHITTGSSNREDSSLTGEYAFFDRSIDVRTSGIFLFDAEAVIVGGEGQDFVPKYFEGKFDLHQRTYAIMDFENAYGKFLFYYIGYYRHYFLSQAVGSTVKSLRLPMFQKMPINLPSVKEQQKIATVLTNADKEIELLEQQLADLQQEKKALMQVLLTGKKRILIDG
ncbi:restriction endonuclease subunit S [Psychrobacter sp. SWN149]|uniref:restriction endonuclease subunit S n=1 Tax=Psychrobacter sp. SWN149 TaxID=2792057 RepID=UPI0018CDEEBA|nr:restriction endonuclease subunit S [Psychrobacter sp. SWN149]MBH0007080.1 restriction endonuclease subunit S [Psychrobacter sp. SWN149]